MKLNLLAPKHERNLILASLLSDFLLIATTGARGIAQGALLTKQIPDLRIRELVDVGDAKDNRIRELEAQLRQKEGNPFR